MLCIKHTGDTRSRNSPWWLPFVLSWLSGGEPLVADYVMISFLGYLWRVSAWALFYELRGRLPRALESARSRQRCVRLLPVYLYGCIWRLSLGQLGRLLCGMGCLGIDINFVFGYIDVFVYIMAWAVRAFINTGFGLPCVMGVARHGFAGAKFVFGYFGSSALRVSTSTLLSATSCHGLRGYRHRLRVRLYRCVRLLCGMRSAGIHQHWVSISCVVGVAGIDLDLMFGYIDVFGYLGAWAVYIPSTLGSATLRHGLCRH